MLRALWFFSLVREEKHCIPLRFHAASLSVSTDTVVIPVILPSQGAARLIPSRQESTVEIATSEVFLNAGTKYYNTFSPPGRWLVHTPCAPTLPSPAACGLELSSVPTRLAQATVIYLSAATVS